MHRTQLLFYFSFLVLVAPVWGAPVPSVPSVAAKSYILQDFHSGRVLGEDEAYQRVEPASLTKMMTAYVVFAEVKAGNVKLDEKVLVSERAWRMPGSRMFIEVDKYVSVEDLLKGLIIQSGNDASVALAEYVAGGEDAFAELMNQHAKRLAMSETHFVNSTGLPDPDHYSTARDMAILARALIRDFPEHYPWHAEKEFTYNGINQRNRNKLLWQDESVDGIKTGHTEAAGYCLVATATREGMRLISVVMGARSENTRARESLKLLNYGFRFYETHRLYQREQPLTRVRVWKGAAEDVAVGLTEALYVTVPRGQYEHLEAKMELDGTIVAPVAPGQRLGSLKMTLDGEDLLQRPMVSLEPVAEGSLWRQLVDHVMLMWQ